MFVGSFKKSLLIGALCAGLEDAKVCHNGQHIISVNKTMHGKPKELLVAGKHVDSINGFSLIADDDGMGVESLSKGIEGF
jgi:hypothetical protein